MSKKSKGCIFARLMKTRHLRIIILAATLCAMATSFSYGQYNKYFDNYLMQVGPGYFNRVGEGLSGFDTRIMFPVNKQGTQFFVEYSQQVQTTFVPYHLAINSNLTFLKYQRFYLSIIVGLGINFTDTEGLTAPVNGIRLNTGGAFSYQIKGATIFSELRLVSTREPRIITGILFTIPKEKKLRNRRLKKWNGISCPEF